MKTTREKARTMNGLATRVSWTAHMGVIGFDSGR